MAPLSPPAPPEPTPPRRATPLASLRWLVLWLLLTLAYLSIDLPLRLLAGEGWPPGRAALLGFGVIPLVQVAALRFVQWMRRSVRRSPTPSGIDPDESGH